MELIQSEKEINCNNCGVKTCTSISLNSDFPLIALCAGCFTKFKKLEIPVYEYQYIYRSERDGIFYITGIYYQNNAEFVNDFTCDVYDFERVEKSKRVRE